MTNEFWAMSDRLEQVLEGIDVAASYLEEGNRPPANVMVKFIAATGGTERFGELMGEAEGELARVAEGDVTVVDGDSSYFVSAHHAVWDVCREFYYWTLRKVPPTHYPATLSAANTSRLRVQLTRERAKLGPRPPSEDAGTTPPAVVPVPATVPPAGDSEYVADGQIGPWSFEYLRDTKGMGVGKRYRLLEYMWERRGKGNVPEQAVIDWVYGDHYDDEEDGDDDTGKPPRTPAEKLVNIRNDVKEFLKKEYKNGKGPGEYIAKVRLFRTPALCWKPLEPKQV